MKIVEKKISDLIPYVNNSRTHSDDQVRQIAASIKEFGFTNPVLIDEQSGIIAGHGRVMAADKLGFSKVPTITIAGLSEAQKKAYVIADNKMALNAGWDFELLKLEIEELQNLDFDIGLLGFGDSEIDDILNDKNVTKDDLYSDKESGILSRLFIMPPFSVFDTRRTEWLERKRAFKEYGFSGTTGLSDNLIFSKHLQLHGVTESSEFDPVLCEILLTWFSPKGGYVLDPFSGGAVRGCVTALLGRKYTGIDVRPEQIEDNRAKIEGLTLDPEPVWFQGDSRQIDSICRGLEADFLFSCPPYHNLEKYSDLDTDISNMKYPDFIKAYTEIICKSTRLLRDNRFACFVVSEIRSKKGPYKGFVDDTVKAFEQAGLSFYNEAILINNAVSLGIRCKAPFIKSRKLGRLHQNVLIFVKGDPVKAADDLGPVEVLDTEESDEDYGEVLDS